MNKSFTLIEILVVIVVIGILSAFILVGMSSITNSASIAKGQAFANSLRNSLLINLVSEWKFNETGNDTTAKDSWTANNGTLTNFNFDTTDGWLSGSQCVSGGCLLFDGSNDYITIPAATSLDNFSRLSIAFWMRPTNNLGDGYYRSIVDKHWTGGGGVDAGDFLLFFNTTNGQLWWEIDTGIAPDDFSYWTCPSKDAWYYIVLTWERNVYNGMKFYVNGISSGTSLGRNTRDVVLSKNQAIILGGSSNKFKGMLDDMRIYNQTVPVFEIQQNYFAGINKLFKNSGIVLNEFNQRLVELKSSLANN